MSSKFLNISTDTTLGGSGASDTTVSSQKAIKAYVDSQATGGNSFLPYGESTTEADTAQKEVTISSITSLNEGQIIIVKPTITSTVADSTLKLNNFTAYPMKYGSAAITTSTDSVVWAANYPSWFRFDGSNWVFLGHGVDNNTTYSAMTTANGIAGTETTARLMRADRLKPIIQGTTLTGLSTSTNSAVVATDSITIGIGKLQAQVNTKQSISNLVTSVSSSSTDSQYPSAKLFYDTCGDIESAINTIRGV